MRWPWPSRRREIDLTREMSDHIDLEREEQERRGHSPSAAGREARLAFGNPAVVREDVREAWGGMWLERLLADVRYAVRIWTRTPAFTLIAVATLSLAIGATTVIFAQINAVFLKPLPVTQPESLRLITWASAQPTFVIGPNVLSGPVIDGVQTYGSISYPAYTFMRDASRAFSDIACWSDLGEARPVVIGERGFGAVQFVSGNYFRTLGVTAMLGRVLQPDDDRLGSWSVAVISDSFWKAAFGADPNVTRQSIDLNGRSFAVVGVMAHGFFGVDPSTTPDVVVPLHAIEIAAATQNPLVNRGLWNPCRPIARLAAGVSSEQASTELTQLLADSIRQHPPAEPYDPPRVLLVDASRGLSTLRESSTSPLLVLFGVVLALSLASCANLAGLLLARGTARHRELATRLALGAPRGRLVRQLLTESLVLAAAGCVLGLAVTYAMSGAAPRLLSQFLPTLFGADRALSVSAVPDLRVFLFAALAALVFGLLFRIMPAIRLPDVSVIAVVRQATAHGGGRFSVGGHLMVAAQAALAILLLVGAGLFLRTTVNLRAGDVGFAMDGLIYAHVEPRAGGVPQNRRGQYFEDAIRRLERIPGLVSASASSSPPMSSSGEASILSGTRELCGPMTNTGGGPRVVGLIGVAPRFFETLGVRVLAGRELAWTDSGPGSVATVVNHAFVSRDISGGDAIGRPIRVGFPCGQLEMDALIVGVVEDTRATLRSAPAPTMYVSLLLGGRVTLVTRASSAAPAMIPTIRAAIKELNPRISTFSESTVLELRERHLRQERLLSGLLMMFSLVTLTICCLGIYGLLSYSVVRRRAEISVRMAIGAGAADVVRMVVRESVLPVLAGAAFGIAAASAMARWAHALLFEVSSFDPLAIGGAVVLFLVVAACAAAIPARSATRVDPVLALRQ